MKEECITEAREDYGVKSGDTIAIGEVERFTISVDAEDVLDRIKETAYELCGESSDGWLDDYTEINSLSKNLTECVEKWLKETKQIPSFYGLKNIRTVMID